VHCIGSILSVFLVACRNPSFLMVSALIHFVLSCFQYGYGTSSWLSKRPPCNLLYLHLFHLIHFPLGSSFMLHSLSRRFTSRYSCISSNPLRITFPRSIFVSSAPDFFASQTVYRVISSIVAAASLFLGQPSLYFDSYFVSL